MPNTQQPLDTLKDIRHIMERSSRFISLSGWSGVAAGCCAMIGAWIAQGQLTALRADANKDAGFFIDPLLYNKVQHNLFLIAVCVLFSAIFLAFCFTYYRSKKQGIGIWGISARRLIFNTTVPLFAGGVLVLRMLEMHLWGLIAPCCLIFYGLALVNGSKYTVGEIRYLGYTQVALGLINCWFQGYAITFWTLGFGICHIVYGLLMWWKYERSSLVQ